jgi:hypothetical protein
MILKSLQTAKLRVQASHGLQIITPMTYGVLEQVIVWVHSFLRVNQTFVYITMSLTLPHYRSWIKHTRISLI